jgi:tungstate transport system substrate-binding protein
MDDNLSQAAPRASPPPNGRAEIRVAVIGGIAGNGFWKAVSGRFVEETGTLVTLVATGPKQVITPYMQRGEVDLLSMHASDAIINLVADGYAADPQPWLRNDLILAGPPSDPAGIRGLTDAIEALRQIVDRHATFVVHASLGAQEVLRHVLSEGNLQLEPSRTITLLDDKHHRVLQVAAEKGAYALIGRLPYLNGKIPSSSMQIMVRGDARLRRPYLAVTANPRRFPHANVSAARELVDYLRSSRTQAWIGDYGRGLLDDHPLFFRIAEEASGK